MNKTHIKDLQEIRQIYLQHLTGNIPPREQQQLKEAMKDPEVKVMCQGLEDIYKDPRFRELLLLKPTSKRWNELWEMVTNDLERQSRNIDATMNRLIFFVVVVFLLMLSVACYFVIEHKMYL